MIGEKPGQKVEIGASTLAAVVVNQLEALEKSQQAEDIGITGLRHADALGLVIRWY